jgi:ribose transport system substrate-binding protein
MPRSAYLALAVACLMLNGCGSKPEYKYRIAVVPKGLTHEFWQSIHRGAERAAVDLQAQKGLAVKVLWDGPAREDEAQPQIDVINKFIAQDVSGLVLAPQHSKTMIDPVKEAVRQKVPVVIIDSGLDAPDLYVKYVATDNRHGGRLAAEHLLKVLSDEGKVAPRVVLFRYQSGSESTMQREQGFLDVIDEENAKRKEAGRLAVTLVSKDVELGATKDVAESRARPLLEAKRDEIDGIFAPNESSAHGVAEALRSLGLNRKIKLVGFDSSAPLLEALRSGDVDGLVVQDPYRMGYLGVWTMVMHLEGRDVAPGGKKNESTGENVITRDNVDAKSSRELFDEKMQGQRTIAVPEYLR